MTTIDGATYSIGSTLTSWKFPSDIFNSTSDYDVYVAFASSGPGFPLTILKFDANGQNGQKVGEWSTAISSPTVSPATESSAFTYLIWLGPLLNLTFTMQCDDPRTAILPSDFMRF